MYYKITIFGACAPHPRLIYRIELHRLSRKEKKMTCHQNLGPAYDIILQGSISVDNKEIKIFLLKY